MKSVQYLGMKSREVLAKIFRYSNLDHGTLHIAAKGVILPDADRKQSQRSRISEPSTLFPEFAGRRQALSVGAWA
jgi:hypothetical protein